MSMNARSTSPEVAVQPKKARKTDQRIRRTHERLGSALVELIQEKPVEDVTVQQVLDRANVGRSTFYLHYRDKDDLLLTQLEGFLQMMSTVLIVRKEDSHRVLPVAEMFEHIGSEQRMYRALAESGHLAAFFDLAQGYFARGIEQRLRESKRVPNLRKSELAIRSVGFAGSLLSLLRWWMDRGAKEPASEIDATFHQMVWSGPK
jgi:AcrR family transcriptional regulator